MSLNVAYASLLRQLGRGYARVGGGPLLAALLLLVAGAAIVTGLRAGARPHVLLHRIPPHTVLEARFTTINLPSRGLGERSILWVDPTLHQARLQVGRGQTLYYARDSTGAWLTGRRGADGTIGWARIPAAQVPSLLTQAGVRALFARLQRQADPRTVQRVALGRRPATVFTTTGVAWPFLDHGPVTVWLDGVTGLPLQFRTIVPIGTKVAVSITRVDQVRVLSSSTLPAPFYAPSLVASSPMPYNGGR